MGDLCGQSEEEYGVVRPFYGEKNYWDPMWNKRKLNQDIEWKMKKWNGKY